MRPALSPVYSLHKVPTAKKIDNTLLYEYEIRYIPAEVVQAESHCLRLADDIYDDYFYKPTVAKKITWRQRQRHPTEPLQNQNFPQVSLTKDSRGIFEDSQHVATRPPNNDRKMTTDITSFPGLVMQAINPQPLQQQIAQRISSENSNDMIDGLSFQYINPSNRSKHQQETLEEIYYQRARSSSLSNLGEARRALAHVKKKKALGNKDVPERAITNPGRSGSALGDYRSKTLSKSKPKLNIHAMSESNPLVTSDPYSVARLLKIKSGCANRQDSRHNSNKLQEPLVALRQKASDAPANTVKIEKIVAPQGKVFGTSALIVSRSQSNGTKSLSDTAVYGVSLSAETASAYTPIYLRTSNNRSSGVMGSHSIVSNMFEPHRSATLALHNSRMSRDSMSSVATTTSTLDPRPSLITSNLSHDYPDLKDKLVENVLNTLRSSVLTINDLDPDMTLRESNTNGLRASVVDRLLKSEGASRSDMERNIQKVAIPSKGSIQRTRRVVKLQSTPTVSEPPRRPTCDLALSKIAESSQLNSAPNEEFHIANSREGTGQDNYLLSHSNLDILIEHEQYSHGDTFDEVMCVELGVSTPPNLSEL